MTDVKSHIQMPKCVLKNFENEKQTLYYYDFKEIKKGRAASLNTELGYYSSSTENYLRDEIETPFGIVMKYVKEINIGDEFIIKDDFINSVMNYLYALLCRGNAMLTSINNHSVYFKFLKKQNQHDLVAVQGIELAKKIGIFNNWEITFSINNSNTPFVLPLLGLYQFSYKTNECILLNMPITPNHAITLFPKKFIKEFAKNNVIKLFNLSDDASVHTLNRFAFQSEEKNNNKCIISNKKEELELLINNNRFRKEENI